MRQGPLLVDGIHHLDVERRRLVEATRGVVKEDVSVFKEPRGYEQRERNTDEACFGGDKEQKRKDDDDGHRAAAGGTD